MPGVLPGRGGDQLQGVHPVEHDIASGKRLGRVSDRVGRAGGLNETGKGRGLLKIELGSLHTEEVAGCGLDAVGLAAVVHEVEVPLQDLVLGLGPFQRDRVFELLKLARVTPGGGSLCGHGVLVAQGVLLQRDLDVLLGQGRRALGAAAPQVGKEGAADALGVDAAMLVETAVLDGNLGLSHDRGNLGERHDDAVLVVWGSDQ